MCCFALVLATPALGLKLGPYKLVDGFSRDVDINIVPDHII